MKSVDLAIKAGRVRQSPQTGFVHHSYENPQRGSETIPVFENFCFALALFRTKVSENVLEGKALLEKLFAFQTATGFPVYLHEYPAAKSERLQNKLSMVAQFLLRDFSLVLGENLRTKLACIVKENVHSSDSIDTLLQDPTKVEISFWDPEALCFTGSQKQERGEPETTLIDLMMGEWGGKYSARALADHPIHLQASLIYPRNVEIKEPAKSWTRLFWGDGHPTYSALLDSPEEGNVITLPEKEVHDEMEISYYINRFPGAQFTVNGIKATTFQLGEPVRVESGGKQFEIVFTQVEGDGRFWGHIHMGNRPGQVVKDKHEAFDWRIALRTIERTKSCRIKIDFRAIP